MNKINTLNEKHLHASLKQWYLEPGDEVEVLVDGYLIDIVRGSLLIEIQTRNFSALKRKLKRLSALHEVRLVYPVAAQKWLVKMAADGKKKLGRRKSPKHCCIEHVFTELIRFPALMTNPNFSLEVIVVHEEEVRLYKGKRSYRNKGWRTLERRLLEVVERRLFETPSDLADLIPSDVAEPFSTADLAEKTGQPTQLCRQMAYCLRLMDEIEVVGKKGNALLYERTSG